MTAFFAAMAGDVDLLDPRSLQANQHGEITEDQNQRLTTMIGWAQGCGTLVLVLFIVPLLLGLAFLLSRALQIDILLAFLGAGVVFLLLFLAVMGRNLWQVWQSFSRLKRDRENRAIRQAQGQLSYGKNGYVLQAGERALALPAAKNAGGLLPGASYRVYYLEETGFVLSAEETAPASPAQVRKALGDILAIANSFSLEDLGENRSGQATASQRRKVLPQVITGGFFGLMAIAFVVPFSFAVLSVRSGNGMPFLLIPVLIAVAFLLVGVFIVVNALLDFFVSTPQQVQGPGHKEKRVTGGKHRQTHYYYVVAGQRFEVHSRAYAALIDGLAYRIYYLPRTNRLISIESLDATPDAPQVNFNPF